ncbi:hypothetical protein DPMN_008369 [Dreissena polymorpha]|uniref:Uncharacterized protein n=1 Tax=Dreissena polymorpha TaxID=45954 RepID=A0A9D4MXM4_DREPO|nr:hypothetical protein DPMN_008369 [Dreissena polymorpha]
MSSIITIARLHSPSNKKTVSDCYGSEKTKIQSTENENGKNLHVQEVEETEKDGNVPKHEVPLSIIDMSDVITVSDTEDKDKEQKRDQLKITHISQLFDFKSKQNNGRQTKIVRPIPVSAVKPESPAKDGKSDSHQVTRIQRKLCWVKAAKQTHRHRVVVYR